MIGAARIILPQRQGCWRTFFHVLQYNELRMHEIVLQREPGLASWPTVGIFKRNYCHEGTSKNYLRQVHIPSYVYLLQGNGRLCSYQHTCMSTSNINVSKDNSVTAESSDRLTDKFSVGDSDHLGSTAGDKAKIMDFLKLEHPDSLNEKTPAVVDVCLKYELPTEGIIQLISESPDVQAYKQEQLSSCISLLLEYGFSPNIVTGIVRDFPDVVRTKPKTWSNVTQFLHTLGFDQTEVNRIIVTCPAVLCVSVHDMQVKYLQIMSICKKTDAISIILNTPVVLTDSWSSIETRYNYVTQEMGMKMGAILRACVFNYSLQHIRVRHLFLLKAGLFDKPDKHGNTKVENPSLRKILEHSDENFACKVAGMSLAEYLMFQELVQQHDQELLDEEDEDSEEDEDEESE